MHGMMMVVMICHWGYLIERRTFRTKEMGNRVHRKKNSPLRESLSLTHCLSRSHSCPNLFFCRRRQVPRGLPPPSSSSSSSACLTMCSPGGFGFCAGDQEDPRPIQQRRRQPFLAFVCMFAPKSPLFLHQKGESVGPSGRGIFPRPASPRPAAGTNCNASLSLLVIIHAPSLPHLSPLYVHSSRPAPDSSALIRSAQKTSGKKRPKNNNDKHDFEEPSVQRHKRQGPLVQACAEPHTQMGVQIDLPCTGAFFITLTLEQAQGCKAGGYLRRKQPLKALQVYDKERGRRVCVLSRLQTRDPPLYTPMPPSPRLVSHRGLFYSSAVCCCLVWLR